MPLAAPAAGGPPNRMRAAGRPDEARAAGRPDEVLIDAIRSALAGAGDPERARGQQRYMKSAMPYRGITSGELRLILRPLLGGHRIGERADWAATVLALWDDANYREERYAATALTGHRHYRGWQDPQAMPLYEHLVVTGAWWDHVDEIAAHRVGPILAAHRDTETARMLAWSVADDMWLRRVSILCQLSHKGTSDLGLLEAVILNNLAGTAYGQEFFIRKAIGWALRQHARVDADWVGAFVAAHRDRLSGLSIREALKHLPHLR